MTTRRAASRLCLLAALTATSATVAATSCSSKTEEAPAARCVAGKAYYCRCPDRSEGQSTCRDDHTLGPCEPCDEDDTTYPPWPSEPEPTDADEPDSGPAARCGDGVVQEGEDCDDGNDDATDGCSSSCRIAGATAASSRTCPGLAIHLWSKQKATYEGWTTGSTNTGQASPPCPDGNKSAAGDKAADRVFHVIAHAAGTLTVATRATNFDHFLYVGAACEAPGPVAIFACANATSTTDGETLRLPVQAGDHASVFVDGTGSSSGKVTIDFSIEE